MSLFNETDFIYSLVNNMTQDITGSLFLTLLLITLGIMLFALAFRIALEFTSLLVFPLLIGFAAEGGAAFMSVTGVFIIYISILLAKNFFFWK